jgi:hypothetical protein
MITVTTDSFTSRYEKSQLDRKSGEISGYNHWLSRPLRFSDEYSVESLNIIPAKAQFLRKTRRDLMGREYMACVPQRCVHHMEYESAEILS